MNAARSPHLDCLPPNPYGPRCALLARSVRTVGGRQKVARRASFQLFPPTHRTVRLLPHFEGRTAA
ncbi:hypothetical protein SAMN05216533_3537 [Streptomyces sp. Ag109_O5-10]|nr:hypothetical protein SAMN05216533_3537 [Streptomyces sp. Ag109_O5-10]